MPCATILNNKPTWGVLTGLGLATFVLKFTLTCVLINAAWFNRKL